MAEGGYTSSQGALEAKRGWATVVGTNKPDVLQNLDLWLGTENEDYLAGQSTGRWEILRNSFKPFLGACGLLLGRATPSDYEDNIVLEHAVIAIRDRITAKIDTSIAADSARVTVALENGEVFMKYVEHAVGSRANPLCDTKLQEKFIDGCKSVSIRDAEAVSQRCLELEDVDDMQQFIKHL
ncbi:hypothetical protein FOPG_12680 [Fusarium oxysporum f. sp. conglutinans race 2 54008]|uniref:MmgE/PrpD C-terminal domain-containing protein n=1 Tax=Fusarium oxysporum f. sp. conglutinans race 2 54008 TaxID=1089457 RepID=X0H6G9_FUSOX|nr:hypothetical protein FOPG_12680 [Fusarium oxysporum f. sp. conglutinans race 2 54008]